MAKDKYQGFGLYLCEPEKNCSTDLFFGSFFTFIFI